MLGVADKVGSFITDDLGGRGTAKQLADDRAVIREGSLDHLGILTPVQFLQFSCALAIDCEIVPEHPGSVTSIARYVLTKQA